MTPDPLDTILELALEEKALRQDTLGRFAVALRERARLILDERVRSLEDRAKVLESENAWRLETLKSIEEENRWLKQQTEGIGAERDWLKEEHARAAAAHDRLLAHHRRVLSDVAETLAALPAALPWGFRHVRAQIEQLLATLRGEVA